MKNTGVTFIFLFSAARTVRTWTMLEMNIVEPIRLQMLNKVSFGLIFSVFPPPLAEMAEKMSGAPFPKANSVTPARDSDI